MTEIDYEKARFNMIEQQIRPWEVLDPRVLEVLGSVPREDYVPTRYRALAFTDVAIPLGHGEVMMHPNVEGRLLQALAIKPGDRILEVGTGSGFLSACLARLGREVRSVDIHPEFSAAAADKLRHHGVRNVLLETGDAARDWGEGLFDVVVLTGSLPQLFENWRARLAPGGRLFAVVGEAPVMEATLVIRGGEHECFTESLFETVLPPLKNADRPVAFEF